MFSGPLSELWKEVWLAYNMGVIFIISLEDKTKKPEIVATCIPNAKIHCDTTREPKILRTRRQELLERERDVISLFCERFLSNHSPWQTNG